MERLSPQDASFLYIENEINHMHIASVTIFAGPPPKGGEIEEMIGSKLDRVPRYRQRIRFVPLEINRPVWVDDAHFDLGYHVRHTALPAPGSADQLRTLVGRVMSQQLDRAKPLWEIWVVEGLDDGRWALLSKTHHCMVDGVAGTDLLSALLDDEPAAVHPAPAEWQPERRPSDASLLIDGVRDTLISPREVVRTLRSAVERPRGLWKELTDLGDGLRTMNFSESKVESSLNGPIGPHRRWRQAGTTIADVKKIREVHGGTVNDVVLAAITHGFRDLLLSRGEPVRYRVVRTLIPVSVRREGERGTLNNRVSAMFAELPVGVEDPVERLEAIRGQMDNLKEHHQAVAAETLTSLTGFAPPALLALGARLFAGTEQHTVQTVATNVPGPQRTLYAAGRPMLAAYPYVPLVGSVRIGVAIFSYIGQLTFGVTCDASTVEDVDVLTDGIENGVAALLATC
jgi:WS/DGAT/MGAT family acyltransferase